MAFNLESYVEHSRSLSLDGIDFARAREWPLGADELRALEYFTDVEGHTPMWVRGLLNTNLRFDPRLTTFISCWSYEELFHSRAIDKFLRAYGAETGAARITDLRRGLSRLAEGLTALAVRGLDLSPSLWRAVYLTWGAAAEFTTLTGYQLIAKRTQNPILREVLVRIGRDERKHFAFYFNEAKDVLATSSLIQKATFTLLSRLWTPVGTGVKEQAEVDFLMTYLADAEGGREQLLGIDRTIAKLPGLAGFARMRHFMKGLGLFAESAAA